MLKVEQYAEFEYNNPDATTEDRLDFLQNLLRTAEVEHDQLLRDIHTPPFSKSPLGSGQNQVDEGLKLLSRMDDLNGRLRAQLLKTPRERLEEKGIDPDEPDYAFPDDIQEISGPPDPEMFDLNDDEDDSHIVDQTENILQRIGCFTVEEVVVNCEPPEPDDHKFYLVNTYDGAPTKLRVARYVGDGQWIDVNGNTIEPRLFSWYDLNIVV